MYLTMIKKEILKMMTRIVQISWIIKKQQINNEIQVKEKNNTLKKIYQNNDNGKIMKTINNLNYFYFI